MPATGRQEMTMPLVLMSNPGMHLALLGNPGRRRRSKAPRGFKNRKSALSAVARARRRVGHRFSIPRGRGTYRIDRLVSYRSRTGRRVHAPGVAWSGRRGGAVYRGVIKRKGHRKAALTFTNPGSSMSNIIRGYVGAIRGAPSTVTSTIKSGNAKTYAFMAAGAVGSYVGSGAVVALAKRIPGVGPLAAGPIGSRILGVLGNFTVGYLASRFIAGDRGKAILAGSIVAGLVEAVAPGQMDRVVGMIPGIGPQLRNAKLSGLYGLGGYVSAPSYQGVGGYVSAPSYQGVGGYVSAPSYQGVGDEEALAADAENALADNGDDDGVDGLANNSEEALAGLDGYLQTAPHYMATYLDG